MDDLNDHKPITPESILMSVREMIKEMTAASIEEIERRNAASIEEAERRNAASIAEAERRNAASIEEAERRNAASIAEEERRNAEEERRNAEAERRKAEFELYLKQSSEKFDRELQKSQAKADKEMKELRKEITGIGFNNGAAAQEFFYNSLKYKRRNMFGEKFDAIFTEEKRKTKIGYEDEYDIILLNGKAACIVEVKYKADTNDIHQVLRKERTFRVNFPEHKDKKLYLALASMSFHKRTEKACTDNGIAIIKQVGNTAVINDKHLKVF